jgi:precorrin-4 methylase
MANQSPPIHIEDVPLDEARRMGRGSRMDPQLYHALKENIQSLDNTATRLPLPAGTTPTMMKHPSLRLAAELNIPVTVRKVRGGLLFWRSTDEDLQQAKEVVARLQSAQQPPHTTRRGRR